MELNFKPGTNFVESVMVSEKSLLTKAANSDLMVSIFKGDQGIWAYIHPVTKDSLLTGLVQNFSATL